MITKIFGYSVKNTSLLAFVEQLLRLKNQPSLHRVVTLNPEMIVMAEKNLITKSWLMKADSIIADGHGLKLASWILRKGNISIITGVQLVMTLLKQKGLTFYFVGSTPDVMQRALLQTKKHYPDAVIVGSSHGYFSEFERADIVQSIVKLKPDVILVGMGFPKQEYFIQTLSQSCDSGIVIGVGGSFEVLAGTKKLAPYWVSSRGGEWLFRSFQDPKRILRWKYLFYFLVFTIQSIFSVKKE